MRSYSGRLVYNNIGDNIYLDRKIHANPSNPYSINDSQQENRLTIE